ncbi:MAG: DUF1109 family protein [Bdellovibrionales bacterium]|nr:DUF1109 family protein [Bdellovibrionales bacterium]
MESNQRPPFIDELVDDLEPVIPLTPIPFRLFATLIPSFIIVLGGSFLLGWERVFEFRMSHWSFWLEQALLLVISISATYSALSFSVPGRSNKKLQWSPVSYLALWATLLLLLFLNWSMFSDELKNQDWHPTFFCPTVLAVMSLPAGLILARLVLKGAVFSPSWTGFFVALSSCAIAAFGLQMSCHVGHPAHLLLMHFLPALIIALAGVYFGRRFLKWRL